MPSAQVVVAPEVIAAMWSALPTVSERVVAAVIAEVPSYTDAFRGRMGRTIERAVQQALEGFLDEAAGPGGDRGGPSRPGLEGAYALGRGEARNERSTDVLLAAYRIGATVAWRDLSGIAVTRGVDGATLAVFAELMFAYIDRMSAFSVAGHADELAVAGLVLQRNREQLVRRLLAEASPDDLDIAAERAGWTPPRTLTAVAVPTVAERGVVALVDARTLRLPDDHLTDLTPHPTALLLVPDLEAHLRTTLIGSLAGHAAIIGPVRPWTDVASSVHRVVRTITLHRGTDRVIDTEEHLVELVVSADSRAIDDLRNRALAPLDHLRPAAREKLEETLRAWLLHQGRRDDVAAALFVHPQTVRYRVGQLREIYGDRLTDPATVLELTVALA